MSDILGLYLSQKREETARPAPLTGWRFVLARVVCPDCRYEFTISPMLGKPTICPGCQGLGLVMYGPFLFADDKPPICAAYLLMETGTQSWIFHASYYDFPSGDMIEDKEG
jgi:hypothetical protein